MLGTRNTSLPDLGGETEGVFLVGAADKDELVSRLEHLAGLLPNHLEYRVAARKCAERFTWARFRDGINRLL